MGNQSALHRSALLLVLSLVAVPLHEATSNGRVWPGSSGVGASRARAAQAAVTARTTKLEGPYIGEPSLRADGTTIVATSANLYLLAPDSGLARVVFSGVSGVTLVTAPVVSQDGSIIVVGRSDAAVSAFNTSDLLTPLLWTSQSLPGRPLSLSFSADDDAVFVTTDSTTVYQGRSWGSPADCPLFDVSYCYTSGCGEKHFGIGVRGALSALARDSGVVKWSYTSILPCQGTQTGSIATFAAVSPQPSSLVPSPPAVISGWSQQSVLCCCYSNCCLASYLSGSLLAQSSSGNILWSRPFDSGIKTAPFLSPDSTLVYIGSGSKYYAVAVISGIIQSTFETSLTSALFSPVIASGMIFAIAGGNAVSAWSASTGALLWSAELREAASGFVPAVSANLSVYIATTSGIRAFNQASGAAIWSISVPSAVATGVAIGANGDLVVGMGDGRVSFLSTCPRGTYCPTQLQLALPCPFGYGSGGDQSSCTPLPPCAAGTFMTGSGECSLCWPNLWQLRGPHFGCLLRLMRIHDGLPSRHGLPAIARLAAQLQCWGCARCPLLTWPADLARGQPDQPARRRPACRAACALPADDVRRCLRRGGLGHGRGRRNALRRWHG